MLKDLKSRVKHIDPVPVVTAVVAVAATIAVIVIVKNNPFYDNNEDHEFVVSNEDLQLVMAGHCHMRFDSDNGFFRLSYHRTS